MARTTDRRIALAADYVRASPEGVPMGEVWAYFGGDIPQRTIQRWLTRLCADRTLAKRGRHRFTRYFPAPTPPPAPLVCPFVHQPDRAPGCPYLRQATVPGTPAGRQVTSPVPPRAAIPPSSPAPPPIVRPTSAPIPEAKFTAFNRKHVKMVVEERYDRDTATFLLNDGAVMLYPVNYDDALKLINRALAALDALTESQLPFYGLTAAQYHAWKRQWKRG